MICTNEKWVKLMFNENETINLIEKDGFELIGVDKYNVNGNTDLKEIKGVDGAIAGMTTYGVFDLNLTFRYTGVDSIDLDLFCFELENILHRRQPYYLVHGKMPGLKYLVAPSPKVEKKPVTIRHMEFEMSFTCINGYAESLYETNQYERWSGNWQFSNGLVTTDDVKYKHNTSSFQIYNGSSDTINPFIHRNKLTIRINIEAPQGFKMLNRNTGEIYEYKKPLNANQQLVIQGIYSYIDGKHVGINTNHEWLSLEKGYNKIEIIGKGITKLTVEFIFPFIYK